MRTELRGVVTGTEPGESHAAIDGRFAVAGPGGGVSASKPLSPSVPSAAPAISPGASSRVSSSRARGFATGFTAFSMGFATTGFTASGVCPGDGRVLRVPL